MGLILRVKIIVAFFISVVVFVAGTFLSQHKPLWNDELYTQANTIQKSSYQDLLTVRFEEGSSAPLYYLIQKLVLEISGYHLEQWQGEWTIEDVQGQIYLRIVSNLSIAIMVAMLFYFFWSIYGVGAAFISVVVSLSTFGLLAYWLEARPYALWMMCLTGQLINSLHMLRSDRINRQDIALWGFWNIAAVLSSVLSIIPLIGCGAVMCIKKQLRVASVALAMAVPLVIAGYYVLQSPSFQFWFAENPIQLVLANYPKDRLFLFVLFIGWVLAQRKELLSWSSCVVLLNTLTLCGAGVLLGYFIGLQQEQNVGFQISNRYFLFLVPVSIVATTMAVAEFLRLNHRSRMVVVMVWCAMACIIMYRVWRSWGLAQEFFAF